MVYLLDLGLGGFDECSLVVNNKFKLSMSFHTFLVVMRPVISAGLKAYPLRVLLRDSGSGSTGTRVWKSSTEKLAMLSWVFVGGWQGAREAP